MKKFQTQKLHLRRETVSVLQNRDLQEVAGGRNCVTGSQGSSDPTPSVCICW